MVQENNYYRELLGGFAGERVRVNATHGFIESIASMVDGKLYVGAKEIPLDKMEVVRGNGTIGLYREVSLHELEGAK